MIELKRTDGSIIATSETGTLRDLVVRNKRNLAHADLSRSNLVRAKLSNADLSDAALYDADLSDADLSYAVLSHACLSHADLSHADLSYANLANSMLAYADLSHADLSYANLANSMLAYADLSYANISNGNLAYANISYANLSHVNLSNANLVHVNLFYANFSDAHMKDVIGLTESMGVIAGNTYWKRFNDGLNNNGHQFYVGLNTLPAGKSFASDERVSCSYPAFHFASRSWCAANHPDRPLEALIRIPEDAQINEPWRTDGRASADKIEILQVWEVATGKDVTDDYRRKE